MEVGEPGVDLDLGQLARTCGTLIHPSDGGQQMDRNLRKKVRITTHKT